MIAPEPLWTPAVRLSPAEARLRFSFTPRRAVTWDGDVSFERYVTGSAAAAIDGETHNRLILQLAHAGRARWAWAGQERDVPGVAGPRLRLIPAGVAYAGAWEGRSRAMHLLLPPDALRDDAGRPARLRPVLDGEDATLTLLMRLLARQAEGVGADLLVRAHLVQAVAAHLVRHYRDPLDGPADEPTDARPMSAAARRRVADYLLGGVRGHGDRPMTAAAVAGVAGVSTRQLSRQFRATFGVTLPRFVMQARAAYALELIRARPHAGRAAIAAAAGFSDQAHLSRTLKQLDPAAAAT